RGSAPSQEEDHEARGKGAGLPVAGSGACTPSCAELISLRRGPSRNYAATKHVVVSLEDTCAVPPIGPDRKQVGVIGSQADVVTDEIKLNNRGCVGYPEVIEESRLPRHFPRVEDVVVEIR